MEPIFPPRMFAGVVDPLREYSTRRDSISIGFSAIRFWLILAQASLEIKEKFHDDFDNRRTVGFDRTVKTLCSANSTNAPLSGGTWIVKNLGSSVAHKSLWQFNVDG